MKWKLNIKDWIKITIIKLLTNKYQNIIKSSSTKIEELFYFLQPQQVISIQRKNLRKNLVVSRIYCIFATSN